MQFLQAKVQFTIGVKRPCVRCELIHFLVKKDLVAMSSLHKWHLINIHKSPYCRCTTCGNGFQFKYQLNNHTNMHTNFQIKCCYQRCGCVYKSDSEYKRDNKIHQREYQLWGKLWEKIWMRIWHFTVTFSGLCVQNVAENLGGNLAY